MTLAATGQNAAAAAVFAGTRYAKLHTGDPGSAGTANAATETTRKGFTSTITGAAATNAAALRWDAYPGTETVTYVSIWSAVSGGSCIVAKVPIEGGTGVAITSGNSFEIPTGDLDYTIGA